MKPLEPLQPEDLLITADLYRRAAREPRLQEELAASRELSSLMTVDPELAIKRFLELALELCPAAGSAGLSELRADGDETHFEWTAMAGLYAEHVGGRTPREFSPCGLCLDHHHTILVDRPARVFEYFSPVQPPIMEGLIVPLFDTGKRPLGTLWVVSHDLQHCFDASDARILEQLAVQLVLALKLRKKAVVMVQLEQVVKDKEDPVHEVHHPVKNTIQMTSALLHLQQQRVSSSEAKAALKVAQTKLLVLANVYEALLHPEIGSASDAGKVSGARMVEMLLNALASTAGGCSDRVTLLSNCDEILLDHDEAVPLGMLLNEAVSNSLKHGVGRTGSGTVNIELRSAEKNCTLVVRNPGRGIAGPPRSESMGMRLMQSLARQLGGKLNLVSDGGAVLTVSWPHRRAHQRSGALQSETQGPD
jgi:two-component sensor histidine kinase